MDLHALEPHAVQRDPPAHIDPIGRLHGQARTFLIGQTQTLRIGHTHGNKRGASINHKLHGLAIDGSVRDKMTATRLRKDDASAIARAFLIIACR